MRKLAIILLIAACNASYAQKDEIGSGRGLQLDGVDDWVDLGNIYNDLHFPITISAWVNIDENVNNWAPVFVSQDNSPIYNGFWFIVQPTALGIGYGDGKGEDLPAFRRSRTATIQNISNKWTYVSAVIRGAQDMDLYVNGINVGGAYSGTSNYPMSSSLGDISKIGFWYSNSQTFRFKGKLDEIRIWNRSLSQDEIREHMCKVITGDNLGLIGYWNFNELTGGTISDSSNEGLTGILTGNPTRIFSGAPVGENSVYKYQVNWSGISLEISGDNNKLVVSNLLGTPEGVQLYSISAQPSQVLGLDNSLPNKPYFGVFIASLDYNNSFDANLVFQDNVVCKAFNREDNSDSRWVEMNQPVLKVHQRGEFISTLSTEAAPKLGPDIEICGMVDLILDSHVSDPSVSILWNTGETSSTIHIQKPGKYRVSSMGKCGIYVDSIVVNSLAPPGKFSLGEDQKYCKFEPIVLKPDLNQLENEYLWQDGSSENSFQVIDYGTYWLTIKNKCGQSSDSITFERKVITIDSIPNVITPNGDAFNEYFKVSSDTSEVSLLILNRWGKEVYFSNRYKNNWNGNELASGVYYYTLSGRCIDPLKGSLTIIR